MDIRKSIKEEKVWVTWNDKHGISYFKPSVGKIVTGIELNTVDKKLTVFFKDYK